MSKNVSMSFIANQSKYMSVITIVSVSMSLTGIVSLTVTTSKYEYEL